MRAWATGDVRAERATGWLLGKGGGSRRVQGNRGAIDVEVGETKMPEVGDERQGHTSPS